MTTEPPTIWHGDGREQALQAHILQHPNAADLRNHPAAILTEIDQWATAHNHCMMTIGPERSQPIVALIRSSSPSVMVELGGYIGYSAIQFAAELRRATPAGTHAPRYYSLECNAAYAAVAQSLIEFAGLGDVVRVLVGEAADSLAQVARELEAEDAAVDLLFVDHWGDRYLPDLLVAERLGLLREGALVVADNVGMEGATAYARWMEEGVHEVEGRVLRYESRTLPYTLVNGQEDAVMISKKI
ncbi:catechol o-methyltransferase-like protein [Aspergillus violaceofuscus CBS 115571]|uniref:catechol O-methyltransferase n=1 Tax=Aspergillus violaceofuscus (strain CBS 115571) TaxID=1450538 RepID=A0A2V5H114_ASPV1|nr:catechol o-methyltransferase-like protein [Aspergillus violaceofuscus CBS 115571]